MNKFVTVAAVVSFFAFPTPAGATGGGHHGHSAPSTTNTNSSSSVSTGGSADVKVTSPVLIQQNSGGWGLGVDNFNANSDNGFGGGVYCRTPSLFVGGNVDRGNTDWDGYSNNYNGDTTNFGLRAGIVVPFGSSVLQDCANLGKEMLRKQKISNDFSLIKACVELQDLGIKVDPKKYPALSYCVKSSTFD